MTAPKTLFTKRTKNFSVDSFVLGGGKMCFITTKGTQMINSDLIQTLVIDKPNLRMNNREKIIDGDLLWRPSEADKNPIFGIFLPKSG